MTVSGDGYCFFRKLDVTTTAINHAIIMAVHGAGRLNSVFFYRRLGCMTGRVDLYGITIVALCACKCIKAVFGTGGRDCFPDIGVIALLACTRGKKESECDA